MTVRYIDSNDKYVQYRLMTTTWSTNPYFWEKYNDITTSYQPFSDFDISDEDGNVLTRFSNGHIKTKNFDSSKDASEEERGLMSATDKTKLNTIEDGAEVNDVEVKDDISTLDLDISDEDRNVLMRLKNGHIETKNFDSSNITENNISENLLSQIKGCWKNKTIAWYGTSIPAGYPNQNNQSIYAYPNIIARMLGANILNFCVPNGVIRATRHDGSPLSNPRLNLSFTKLTSQINYQNSMLDLLETDNEPDLFVFDYGVNDFGEDDSEWQQPIDFESTNTNDFISSYNFVISTLLTSKKDARIIILTHYTDAIISPQSPHYGKIGCKPLNDRIEELANYWNIKLINGRRFVGWNYLNMKYYADDYIHPASNNNVMSVNLLANLYLNELKIFY